MSIFNSKNYYSQRENINEPNNRIVNMWNFVVNFQEYFIYDEKLNDILMYNVKSVELPKYSMKTYKRYFGTSERSFPIKRVCDGTLKITFYARYNLVYSLSRLCQNFVGSEESRGGIKRIMTNSEIVNVNNIDAIRNQNDRCIKVIQYPDTLSKDTNGKIVYSFMKPVLTSIEYNELSSDNNAILEVSCEFTYNDFRIVTDSLYSKDKLTMYGNNKSEIVDVYDYIDKMTLGDIDKRNNPRYVTEDKSMVDSV